MIAGELVMSKNERITKILQNISAVDDWRLLAAICGYPNDAQFEEFVTNIKKRSVKEFGEDVSKGDTILTLSTCANNNKYRVVLHAKKVK